MGRRRRFPHLTPTLSAPGGGEGDFQLLADRLPYTFDILHHISVPKSDHAVASPGDFRAAALVGADLERVLSTIELNDQLR